MAVIGFVVLGVRSVRAGFPEDGFDCYKAKDTLGKLKIGWTSLVDTPGFQTLLTENGCVVTRPPKMVCLPAGTFPTSAVSGGTTFYGVFQPNPLLCYKIKCQTSAALSTLNVSDLTGDHALTPSKEKITCVPACVASAGYCILSSQCCSGTCAANSCS